MLPPSAPLLSYRGGGFKRLEHRQVDKGGLGRADEGNSGQGRSGHNTGGIGRGVQDSKGLDNGQSNNGGSNNGGSNNGGSNNGGSNNGGSNNRGSNNGGTNNGGTNNGGTNDGGGSKPGLPGTQVDTPTNTGAPHPPGNHPSPVEAPQVNPTVTSAIRNDSPTSPALDNGPGGTTRGVGHGGVTPSRAVAGTSPLASQSQESTHVTLKGDVSNPINAALPITNDGPPGSYNTGGAVYAPPTASATSPVPTGPSLPQPPSSSKSTVLAVVITLIILLLLAGLAAFRFLHARRKNSSFRWWFHRRVESQPFHDYSLPSSRGGSPTSSLGQPTIGSSFSTLPAMSFASQGSRPVIQSMSNPYSALEPPLSPQLPPMAVHRHSHWRDSDSMSSDSEFSLSTTTDNRAKLHIHPLSNPNSSPSFSYEPQLPERAFPTLSLNHNTVLSHSSYVSTALSYTDPFSDHISPSTAFATSPEPLSSVPTSSDWHTTESDTSSPHTFSSDISEISSLRESRIIIVGSAQYDDNDSVDYHNVSR